jgi:hypothetical protein
MVAQSVSTLWWYFLPPAIMLLLILLPVSIAFAFWQRGQGTTDLKGKVEQWDVFIKAISMLGLGIAGLMAFAQYMDQRERELFKEREDLAQKTREYNIDLYKQANDVLSQKSKLCHEIMDLSATLASTPEFDDNPDYRIARKRFERLYWGQMLLVESTPGEEDEEPSVEGGMIAFRRELLDCEKHKNVPIVSQQRSKNQLQERCLKLGEACRKDLERVRHKQPAK